MIAKDNMFEDIRQSFPCECGGKIAKRGEYWECDSCDASFFEAKAELI